MGLGSAAHCLWDWNQLPFLHRPPPPHFQNGAMTRADVLALLPPPAPMHLVEGRERPPWVSPQESRRGWASMAIWRHQQS